MRKLLFMTALLLVGLSCSVEAQDWPTFGWDVGRSSAPNVATGLSADRISSLSRQQVILDGTVDGSVIYLHRATVGGSPHDAFFVTTTYGKTLAIDADSGAVLWEYTPASYEELKTTYRITNATPVVDADRMYIYAAAPDGMIRKLAVADGRIVWATAITRLAEREKIASPLSFFNGRVIAATDGYLYDDPPYQGHVAILDGKPAPSSTYGTRCPVTVTSCLTLHPFRKRLPGIWGAAGVVIDSEQAICTLQQATAHGTARSTGETPY